jgi:alpha-L-fucosidase 2
MTRLIRGLLLAVCALLALEAGAAADLALRYDQPAPDSHEGWERQALPIGNGRLGAMLFGQVAHERVQFNDITLWTGDAQSLGSFQAFGDLRISLDKHEQPVSNYQRALHIDQATQTLSYTLSGVNYQREAFASYPAQVIVLRLSADRLASYSGTLQLGDMHGAKITAQGALLQAQGALANGMTYASQAQVLPDLDSGGGHQLRGRCRAPLPG